jgi:hypothetical protein
MVPWLTPYELKLKLSKTDAIKIGVKYQYVNFTQLGRFRVLAKILSNPPYS